MKLFKTFRKFHVFVFKYRATNEITKLEENKILELFLTENLWKGIRVSLGMILRLFCQRRKQIMIFRGSRRFCEFCGIDLAIFYGYLCYCSNRYCPYETNFPSEHCEHIVRAWTITSFKSRYLPGFQKERQKASFC